MSETSPKLVSPSWLLERLDDPAITVLEISSDPEAKAYLKGHVPGAIFSFWKDLLWHETDREFVSSSELSSRLGEIGVSTDSTLVICGDPVQYGTYALWVMTMAGVKDVRILDGSRTRWINDGNPLETEGLSREPIDNGSLDPSIATRIGRDEVLQKINNPDTVLLDVRSPEEYRGERVSPPGGFDHGAERKGRIPGAVHLFFRELLNDDDTFISKEKLERKFSEVGVKKSSEKDIVSYCRLSHRATLSWFAMSEILGIEKAQIYDGSWTEWGSIVGFPIEL
ncbi:MAG: sulfurtransferase [SAR202 cluster bacterium]|nr:MAG: sulfurtransferase [SAR202 cluster bacterium]MAR85625.1 sulfurtransferase [Chloroflexota bacterium]MEC7733047.1 sulfurtransferase [Chloroflexota bacterium]MEE3345440.1 sulfurtransferase [Chloroflexota bacterium]